MTDNRIYRTRSLGIPAVGVADQYADGIAAQLWQLYIGDTSQRTSVYRKFIIDLLRAHNCRSVLDVACGTGVDSVMLLEEGFQVTSVDLSDKMLKQALKTRWSRRREPAFDAWVIEEGNWLTLPADMGEDSEQFDAVICLGNSFAHLPDDNGNHGNHRLALGNFAKMVKPGGLLLIDHRNYDFILQHGTAPSHNIYYNSNCVESIITSLVLTESEPVLVTLDYVMNLDPDSKDHSDQQHSTSKPGARNKFRLSYYPHRVKDFTELLKEAFGSSCSHRLYGDFKPVEEAPDPAFFIHVVQKK